MPQRGTQEATERALYRERIKAIIGIDPLFIGSNGEDCFAVLDSDAAVQNTAPNLTLVSELEERRFIITAKDTTGRYDYIYRAFFPRLDIPEDPVTGSANTFLAPYWSEALNKTHLTAFQASRRGGELSCTLKGDRVLISGSAVTVIEGTLNT